ncbi:CheR family methyltransferase [Herbinix luporum]|uniref:protein-glutamate O-methyltransferase n=1 Tax=Herbinix luporum TaxID=1679721 RepID=A0A0K8J5B7_9FIRM|nr:protein-glutamate O-methyltransferase CheR [Herbinix luporum]CUH92647.1 Chemotaxis protein methyltransferase [Herbinix luporum]HHT56715.1 protein-glutamate O-methyltransferase CheR [Herbinix luporum]
MLGSYEAFKEFIYQLTKIDLNSYKERQMKRRIDALIVKHGISSYKDYVNILKTDKTYYNEFINYITINVSEFYRNPDQWLVLEKDVLPYLFNNFGKQLKIWSAACSTGDEPYSLVMLLAKFLPLNKIKILATDIDRLVLEKAKIGVYDYKDMKRLPPEFVKRYFTQIDSKTYKISDEIKSCVEFMQHDLLKDPYPAECNLIVCRNVLIYFTDEAKNRIYNNFHNALKDNGILFVGSTEQMLNANKLGFQSLKSFFYTKV